MFLQLSLSCLFCAVAETLQDLSSPTRRQLQGLSSRTRRQLQDLSSPTRRQMISNNAAFRGMRVPMQAKKAARCCYIFHLQAKSRGSASEAAELRGMRFSMKIKTAVNIFYSFHGHPLPAAITKPTFSKKNRQKGYQLKNKANI